MPAPPPHGSFSLAVLAFKASRRNGAINEGQVPAGFGICFVTADARDGVGLEGGTDDLVLNAGDAPRDAEGAANNVRAAGSLKGRPKDRLLDDVAIDEGGLEGGIEDRMLGVGDASRDEDGGRTTTRSGT